MVFFLDCGGSGGFEWVYIFLKKGCLAFYFSLLKTFLLLHVSQISFNFVLFVTACKPNNVHSMSNRIYIF